MKISACIIRTAAIIISAIICGCSNGGDDSPPINTSPAWGTAARISANADAQSPAIAMDGAGHAMVYLILCSPFCCGA